MKKQTTIKQAKRKNLIEFIILELIGVACIVVGAIIELMLFGLIFGVVFLFAGVYSWFSTKKAIKHSFCPHCQTKYDYNKDISWDEVESDSTDTTEFSIVEFTCTCPKCGEELTFSQKFVTSTYNKSKDRWIDRNLDVMVKKHFIK